MKNKHEPMYPVWICKECGIKYGRRECGIATWHIDECGVCHRTTAVTEPRDFGHLKEGWEKHNAETKVS